MAEKLIVLARPEDLPPEPPKLTSKFIILPGQEAEEDVPAGFVATPAGLIGRTLGLNTTKIRQFQTFHFYLGPRRQFAQVPPDADLKDIHKALLDGRLIDATDQHKTGMDLGEGSHMDPVNVVEDPDKPRVFIGVEKGTEATDGSLPLFVAIPSCKEEEQDMLEQLRTKGRIDGLYKPQIPDVTMSGISVSDAEERPPIQPAEGFWSLIRRAFLQLFRNMFRRK